MWRRYLGLKHLWLPTHVWCAAELLEGPDELWGCQLRAVPSTWWLPVLLSWAACEVAGCSWLAR